LAKDYYKISDNYSHIQGYVSSLYSLGKCYWKLEDINALKQTINESEQVVFKLKPKDKIVETAYLNYIKAGNFYLNKDYKDAQTYFESALPEILKNEDVTNEYVIYLYLGKIKWQENKKLEAIEYFSKIDSLYRESDFLNYELREAYNYLRTYYKESGQTELQLQATESLITLNQQFEKEQRYLTDLLHHQLETQELQVEKIALQKQLKKNNKHSFGLWVVIFAGVVLVAVVFFVWMFRNKNKSLVVPVGTAIPVQDSIENSVTTDENKIDNTDLQFIGILQNDSDSKNESKQIVSQHKKEDTFVKLTSTEKRLMQEFKLFEAKKEFKKTVTLEQLAMQFGTNRTTLSNFLNTYKGGFNTYLSKLRIASLVADLKTNENLRKKTLQEISAVYGFPNAKAFSSQFKAEINKSVVDYIKLLQRESGHPKTTVDN